MGPLGQGHSQYCDIMPISALQDTDTNLLPKSFAQVGNMACIELSSGSSLSFGDIDFFFK